MVVPPFVLLGLAGTIFIQTAFSFAESFMDQPPNPDVERKLK
jgi:hypothetical protein